MGRSQSPDIHTHNVADPVLCASCLWYNPLMPIHILAPEVANQIAAGEVVERPASVVKELIENSLDAGATDIRVGSRGRPAADPRPGRRLRHPGGRGRPGLPAPCHQQDRTADDLSHLTTLGFRGEALASIASVAQVSLLTRARNEETGTLIRMAAGRETARAARRPPGTLVTVEHLFANVRPGSSSSNSRPPRRRISCRSSPATRWPTPSGDWPGQRRQAGLPVDRQQASCTTCW